MVQVFPVPEPDQVPDLVVKYWDSCPITCDQNLRIAGVADEDTTRVFRTFLKKVVKLCEELGFRSIDELISSGQVTKGKMKELVDPVLMDIKNPFRSTEVYEGVWYGFRNFHEDLKRSGLL